MAWVFEKLTSTIIAAAIASAQTLGTRAIGNCIPNLFSS